MTTESADAPGNMAAPPPGDTPLQNPGQHDPHSADPHAADLHGPASPFPAAEAALPLVVDLDGTLIKGDMLVEGLCQLAGQSVPLVLRLLAAHAARPERLKAEVFARVEIDPQTLPYNAALLDWLRAETAGGREIWLATASLQSVAEPVAAHLGLFRGVLGSDAARNLKGAAKLDAVRAALGGRPFAYAGDSRADLPVWAGAAGAVTVNIPPALLRDPALQGKPVQSFDFAQNRLAHLLRGMRPHQWVKNALVFLPLLAAHRWGEPALIGLSLAAFAAFSLCASAVYLINDLLDIEDDRHHPEKRRRPIAAGLLRADAAAAAAGALMLGALLLAGFAALPLLVPLLVYAAATFAYSLKIKTMAGLDVIWLAGLYTIRVIGGAAATGIVTSTWLLSFCIFIFLSLACAKRCAELVMYFAQNREMSSRRGYRVGDLDIMATIGVAAGFSAVIVLMIYLQDALLTGLYDNPGFLIGIGVVLVWWLCHLWLKVRRGEMDSDPIVFALTDRSSRIAGAVTVLLFFLAAGV